MRLNNKKMMVLLGCALAALSTVTASAQMLINGAGATFPYPIYSKWFNEYAKVDPSVRFNYQSIGSGGGQAQILAETVDFGASDGPMSDEKLAKAPRAIWHLPTVAGADVITYNLEGFPKLQLDGAAIAGIFLGKITKWNDPIIKSANKGVALPNADIVVIHRSDGSGTTYAWSDYLSKVSSDWKTAVGASTTLNWPVGTGVEHNEGIAAMVQRSPNSIGYVELVYAIQHQLSFGAVRNAAGEYIRANLESVTAAAASAMTGNSASPSSITNASGKEAYPIATFTFLLLPQHIADNQKKATLIELLQWLLTSGQRECSALGYAPLPHDIANRQLQSLNSLK